MANVNLQIVSINVTFSAGAIATVTVVYQSTGVAGISGQQSFSWVLTTAEQTATQAFVTSLTTKLATVTGLTATTT